MKLPNALVAALQRAHSIGVITGAGVSAESGIQTYRGQGGLYDDPGEGDRTVEALSGSTLERDPDRTWRTLSHLARMSAGAAPNPAHHAIAEIEQRVDRFSLLTQNVDGLHRDAGSREVIEIHGNLFRTLCLRCSALGTLARSDFDGLDTAPTCPCGGTLRPDVVLFGEMLPLPEVARLRRAFAEHIPDVVISCGTSALFPYIQEPVVLARRAGHVTVEVNPERTDLADYVDFFLQGKAGEVMPLIAAVLPSSRG